MLDDDGRTPVGGCELGRCRLCGRALRSATATVHAGCRRTQLAQLAAAATAAGSGAAPMHMVDMEEAVHDTAEDMAVAREVLAVSPAQPCKHRPECAP